ncbi:uncharacterized protein TNCV_170321 [Trichonephila clavipes]|nr:uncharacterized protein TNCV_170321 [Trichonephila clavipes]
MGGDSRIRTFKLESPQTKGNARLCMKQNEANLAGKRLEQMAPEPIAPQRTFGTPGAVSHSHKSGKNFAGLVKINEVCLNRWFEKMSPNFDSPVKEKYYAYYPRPVISKATRGLLATDHVILNHGQVTCTTPELAPPLLTTTPHQQEDVSALDRFNVHRCPTRRVLSGTGLEPVTKQATVRYLYHSATAATP